MKNMVFLLLLIFLGVNNSYASIWTFMPSILSAAKQVKNKDGLQLVGLSKWSTASTHNCAEAVISSRCGSFEFSYCPFFNLANPFGNADILNSIPVEVTETIFLGWRQEALMLEDVSFVLETLSDRAEQVNTHINEIRGRVSKIILIPILEDYWTEDQWLQAVRVIAAQLDSGDKVTFRRSEMLNTDPPPTNIVTKLKNGKDYNFSGVYLEAHKIDFTGEANTISNDGGFVYNSGVLMGLHEDSNSYSGRSEGYATLDKWSIAAKGSTKTAMLWRPAYNLHTRSISNGYVSYTYPSITLDNRVDDNADPAFNAFEAALVKRFLTPIAK